MFRYISFIFLFCVSSLYCHVENSVIPQVNSLENYQDVEKYAPNQYRQIERAIKQKEDKIRIATFNTLFDLYDHILAEEHRWEQRKARVFEMIQHLNPDVLGVQEVMPNQLKDFYLEMPEKYAYFGLPGHDGGYNAIFFNVERFELVDSRFYTLETEKSLLLVKLKDKRTGNECAFCNTHLSFSKVLKREAEANEIHKILSEYLLEEHIRPCPLILVGDMNTFPNIPSLTKLPFFDGDYIEGILKGDVLVDAKNKALLGHVGPISSFTNKEWGIASFQGTGTPGVLLDHIYVTKDIVVLIHAVERGKVNGHFPSDHMPVFADLIL